MRRTATSPDRLPPPHPNALTLRRAEVMRLLGRRIADVRRQLGWTQADLAHQIGLGRYAVGDMEAGERAIRIDDAVLICDALGVGLVDMLGDAEPVLVTETRIEFKPHATSPR